MAFIKKKDYIKKRIVVPQLCPVCQRKEPVNWKNTLLLRQFITSRGKIMPRSRSGVCARHQRELGKQIKRARLAALLPFIEH